MRKEPVRRQVPSGVRELHAKAAVDSQRETKPSSEPGTTRSRDFIGLPILLPEKFDRQRPYVSELTEWCANHVVHTRNQTYLHAEKMKSILLLGYESGARLFVHEVQHLDRVAWFDSLTTTERKHFASIFPKLDSLKDVVWGDYRRARNEADKARADGTGETSISRVSAAMGSSGLFTFMASLAAQGNEINLLKTAVNTVQRAREAEQKALGTPWTGVNWHQRTWNSSP